MKATDQLSEEHRVIENVLDSMQKALQRMESGQSVPPDFFIKTADFIKGFADGCHHQKEEKVLFVTMNQHGLPTQGGPIGVMLSEHVEGRELTQSMRTAAERLAKGDQSAIAVLKETANAYISLLREHIHKEDNILFKMADQIIPVEEHDEVLEGFERIEHEETGEGVHEKYLALAQSLAEAVKD